MVTVLVASITDGDTFRTSNGEYVRLANVNAPETGTSGAPRATLMLSLLVNGKHVQCETVAMDRGRFVCNVWYNGKSVNETMRVLGYT